ncbi:MAG: hypothetical protein O9302_00280 [Cyclobacteriaceae bacterium]|jgi:hypothetical protein|nr:hypothetical protein [Cytophagales bacterium]MCZ8326467.1 hypothetical protein [Cyclobacteriaceae bacterium]
MAFSGIDIVTKRGSANKPVIGFRGIVVGLQLNLPVRVVDQRGLGQANVRVSIANTNTADPFVAFTDSQGNCLLRADNTNPNPITVSKDLESKTVNYTGGNQFVIVFEEHFFPDI